MESGPSPAISVNQYLWRHADIIYGRLSLLPDQVANMTFLEIDIMNKGFEDARAERRSERAYWISVMLGPHVKTQVNPSDLMRPFMPEKTESEMRKEKEGILKEFGLGE